MGPFSRDNVPTSGAHCRKLCARRRKCAPRAPVAPLISNTAIVLYDQAGKTEGLFSLMVTLENNCFGQFAEKRYPKIPRLLEFR